MSLNLSVFELNEDGENIFHGEYEFQYLPSSNDRVVIDAPGGKLDIMRVAYVEHSPIKLPKDKIVRDLGEEPTMRVYVEFAGRCAT